MIHREFIERPEYIYPAEEWRLVQKRFYPRLLAQNETFFATSNGYLGLRGSFEEGRPVYDPATLINGFYESWPIVYGEEAFGFARTGQTIVNVTDAKTIRLYVDDEPFYLPTAELLEFERALDMRNGTLDREVVWRTPAGKRVSIKSRRIVSFRHRHLAAISYEVTLLDAEAPVVLSSEVRHEEGRSDADDDPRRARGFRGRVLVPQESYAQGRRIVLAHSTRNSDMRLACAVEHTLETECPHKLESRSSDDAGQVVFSFVGQPDRPIRLVKYMSYHTSRSAPPRELCERAERTLSRAAADGFDELQTGQRQHMDEFWHQSDIEVSGEPVVQQALRFNLFHLLQATGRAEGAGVPAKGLTGQGYEGHYFWDTEIYVLPFLTYSSPRTARNLLKFRHGFLEQARQRAREVNQKGALFAWRTINGEEASAYYAAGTAQYHINADIVYALRKYVDITGDQEFLERYGVDILVETARLWVDLGHFSERKDGQFCIDAVTGPDEYNTVVNNNTFTNLMARENLRYAAASVTALREQAPERFTALAHRTQLDEAEIAAWTQAADRMYVPYDEECGIHPQDDAFMGREPWDFENTPDDKYPLLLHHHPLVIYRHKVIKQADVVLAMFLLGHEFSDEQKKRNFDYYDPLTTGDSSLSVAIQAIVANELGYVDQAIRYAWYAAQMDLGDVGRNVKDGCHIASMGGAWMAVIYGTAGLRDWAGEIRFHPRCPRRLDGLRFRLRIRGRLLELKIDRKGTAYRLVEGDELTFWHADEELRLTADEPGATRPHA